MEHTQTATNVMISMSVLAFCSEKGFNSIAKTVSSTVNDVPFVTLLHATEKTAEGKTAALNLFFSKNASAKLDIHKGDVVDRELLSQLQVTWSRTPALDVKDEAGVVLEEGFSWKLTTIGDSEASPYQNIANLLA